MLKHSFTEDDYKKVVDLLNFIAKRAVFSDWKTEDTVTHFKLLAHIQQVVLPKIEAHILEIKETVQTRAPEEEPEA